MPKGNSFLSMTIQKHSKNKSKKLDYLSKFMNPNKPVKGRGLARNNRILYNWVGDTMTKKTNEIKNSDEIKRIPYGLSDYSRIFTQNYYYVDKTSYLPTLENAGSYLFFIRPRRFGKSLFISMMEAYYDVYYKDRFDEFFQGTFIHENPTRERNSYLVLTFDFSQVEPGQSKVEKSFLRHVHGQVDSFLKRYREQLGPEGENLIDTIKKIDSAADILSALSRLCRDSHVNTYILIDEYDNFANTILSSTGTSAYHDLTHGEGFFRAFFNVLKGGTSRMEAPFTRLFLTGVSPITMDDVTSGYNIGLNISLDSDFNRMLGITEDDIIQLVEYYRSLGIVKEPTSLLLDLMTRWYGNYLFSSKDNKRMYNTDMVLYFFKHYLRKNEFPEELVDENVKIDYGKLRHLVIVDKSGTPATNGNFAKLKEIIEEGSTTTNLVRSFPLKMLGDGKNFKSLLFYLGLLTIKAPYRNLLRLEIPNESVKHLYYDYIESIYRETGVFSLDLAKYEELMSDMAYGGEWKSLLEFITGHMKNSMSLRDFIEGERMVQAFLNVYLGLSNLYIIHPEYELNKGYSDLLLEPFIARYDGIRYSYLLELKYIAHAGSPSRHSAKSTNSKNRDKLDKKIQKLVKEAEEQLAQYSADEKLAKILAKTTLIKLVLVFHGHEAVYVGAPAGPPSTPAAKILYPKS